MTKHKLSKLVMVPMSVDVDADPRSTPLSSMTDHRSDPGFHVEERHYTCLCGERFDSETAAEEHVESA
jgi:hypothetical protein